MEEYIIEVNPDEVDMPFNGIRLVRCKDCKWQDKKHGCEQNNIWAPDDFYCAYGVKKDE